MLLVVVKEWNPAANHVYLYAVPVDEGAIEQIGCVITTDGKLLKPN